MIAKLLVAAVVIGYIAFIWPTRRQREIKEELKDTPRPPLDPVS